MRRLGVVLGVGLGLGGCAAPALRSYLLAVPPPAVASAVEPLPADVIALRPVLLVDYLDTGAILRVAGDGRLVASRDGRWAERLSVGIRQALAADLQARRPGAAIVADGPPPPGARRIDVTVAGFDLDAAGTLVLRASWSVEPEASAGGGPEASGGGGPGAGVDGGPGVVRRRGRFVADGVAAGDPAQVAAMRGLLDRMAGAIDRDL